MQMWIICNFHYKLHISLIPYYVSAAVIGSFILILF